MNWKEKLASLFNKTALDKEAIDKLPQNELSGIFDNIPGMGGAADQGAPPADDGSGGDPSQAPDPTNMLMPEEPLVFDNKYVVDTGGPKFVIELTPSIVTKPVIPPNMPSAKVDPMGDTSLNPNANPDELEQWLTQTMGPEKKYSHDDKGVVDPLSKEEDGIKDTGDEQSLGKQSSLNKKAEGDDLGPIDKTPGADVSNATYPCKVCPNYNATDNVCSQGIDVEKVQAAKSCSWLNSNFGPFKKLTEPRLADPMNPEGQNANSNPDSPQQSSGAGQTRFAKRKLNTDKLKDLWD